MPSTRNSLNHWRIQGGRKGHLVIAPPLKNDSNVNSSNTGKETGMQRNSCSCEHSYEFVPSASHPNHILDPLLASTEWGGKYSNVVQLNTIWDVPQVRSGAVVKVAQVTLQFNRAETCGRGVSVNLELFVSPPFPSSLALFNLCTLPPFSIALSLLYTPLPLLPSSHSPLHSLSPSP